MRRNAILPKIFVILPVVMLLIVPYAANQEVKNLTFCVVDNDHSTLSRRLVEQVAASEYFNLTAVTADYASAMAYVEAGSADVILEIGPRFERDLVAAGHADVGVSANAVNGVKGALGQAYMLQIIADCSARIRAGRGLGVSDVSVAGVDVRPRYLYNEALDYKVFMVPGIMAMLLTLLIGFLPALNIVGEKERGTIEQINVTPVGRFGFIFSKLVPYWCVGLFVLLWSILWAYLIYGLAPAGSLWLLVVASLIYFLVVSSLGLIVSNYSSTIQQAALLMFFFLVIFILMSGLLTPISSMPEWARALTYVNPLRYYIESMRALYLKGSTLADLLAPLLAMVAYAAVAWAWAVASYRKSS